LGWSVGLNWQENPIANENDRMRLSADINATTVTKNSLSQKAVRTIAKDFPASVALGTILSIFFQKHGILPTYAETYKKKSCRAFGAAALNSNIMKGRQAPIGKLDSNLFLLIDHQ
jgi:hypothetical protein